MEQKKMWHQVVDNKPPAWFPPETHGVLIQYCRIWSRAQHIAKMIDAEEKKGIPDSHLYEKLLDRESKQGFMLASLATKMRLTQRATTEAKLERRGKTTAAAAIFGNGSTKSRRGRDPLDSRLLQGS